MCVILTYDMVDYKRASPFDFVSLVVSFVTINQLKNKVTNDNENNNKNKKLAFRSD